MKTRNAFERFPGNCRRLNPGVLLLVLALLILPVSLHAAECERTTQVRQLMLGETVDIKTNDYELGVLAGRAQNGTEYNMSQFDWRIGFGQRWQLYANWDEKRIIGSHIDHAAGFGIGIGVLCRPGLPMVRLDVGFHHDGANGAETALRAGQRVWILNTPVSWQFGVRRTASIDATRYTGALIFLESAMPIVLESAAEDTEFGWERAHAVAFYPFARNAFQLGLGYEHGGGLSEGESHWLLRIATRF